MIVRRCFNATSEIMNLNKTYRDTWKVIDQFERLLFSDLTHSHDRYSGLKLNRGAEPAQIFKAKVLHPQLGGKASGVRYIYERLMIDDKEYAIALTVYVHAQGTNEQEVIKRIRTRFRDYDPTPDGIRDLDKSEALER